MTEGAVKTDSGKRVAIGIKPGVAIGVYERLTPGVRRVRKSDRLFRTLIKAEHGQRIAEPRRHDEHHHKPEDRRDPDSAKGENRDQDLHP